MYDHPDVARLRQLLVAHISSVEQVEMLLLLARTPERAFSRDEVARALGRPIEPTAMRLFLLSSSGFLAVEGTGRDPRYRFRPADAATAAAAELLLALWTENPRVVTEALAIERES